MSNLDANKKVVTDFLEALGSYDIPKVMELITEDIVFNIPNSSCLGGKITLQEFEPVAGLLQQVCPDGIPFEIHFLTAEEDRVSCVADGHGVTPEDEAYGNRYHFLFRIRDGRICETFEYMDSLLMERIFAPLLAEASS